MLLTEFEFYVLNPLFGNASSAVVLFCCMLLFATVGFFVIRSLWETA